MIKVGLTGGYASGKSLVAARLEELGCHLIYADKLGHEVLLRDGAAYSPTIERFGAGILRSDGSIDRKKLASVVFMERDSLDALTAIVHPAVFRLEQTLMERFAADDPQGIVVVEAAILIETGRFREYDRIIVAACDEATQIARGMKRDGISEEEVRARMANQLPLETKKLYADYVVDTSGIKENTAHQVERILDDLQRVAKNTTELGARG
jgi:dephospho-CoA kinase